MFHLSFIFLLLFFLPVNLLAKVTLGSSYHWVVALQAIKKLWDEPLSLPGIAWNQSQCSHWNFKELQFSDTSWQGAISYRHPLYLQCFFDGKVPVQKAVQWPVMPAAKDSPTWMAKAVEGGKLEIFSALNPTQRWSLSLEVIDQSQGRRYRYPQEQEMVGEYYKSSQLLVQLRIESLAQATSTLMWLHLQRSPLNRYLPAGRYFYGHRDQLLPPILWDNHGRDFYLDLHLVLQFQWEEFLIHARGATPTGRTERSDDLQALMPATGVSLLDQQAYCHWRGAKLLTASLFDAATFYRKTVETNSLASPLPSTSLYPWGNLAPAQLSEKLQSATLNLCHYLQHQGCPVSIPWAPDDLSWIGLRQVTGGYFESFDNPFEPQWNLKTSSIYAPVSSPFHWNAHRFAWNGQGFSHRDLATKSNLDQPLDSLSLHLKDPLKIGFRCYEEYFGEAR